MNYDTEKYIIPCSYIIVSTQMYNCLIKNSYFKPLKKESIDIKQIVNNFNDR